MPPPWTSTSHAGCLVDCAMSSAPCSIRIAADNQATRDVTCIASSIRKASTAAPSPPRKCLRISTNVDADDSKEPAAGWRPLEAGHNHSVLDLGRLLTEWRHRPACNRRAIPSSRRIWKTCRAAREVVLEIVADNAQAVVEPRREIVDFGDRFGKQRTRARGQNPLTRYVRPLSLVLGPPRVSLLRIGTRDQGPGTDKGPRTDQAPSTKHQGPAGVYE